MDKLMQMQRTSWQTFQKALHQLIALNWNKPKKTLLTVLWVSLSLALVSLNFACSSVSTIISNEVEPPPIPAQSWPVQDCFVLSDIAGVSVCYYETGKNPSDSPILFMHGFLDSVDVMTSPSLLSHSYVPFEAGIKSTKMFVVSYGPSWMLSNYPNRVQSPTNATIDVFVNEILPEIKARHPYAGKLRLVGHSMGGSNGAQLLFQHPELFSKGVLLNAMLITDATDPFTAIPGTCPACLLIYVPIFGIGNYSTSSQWKMDRPSANLLRAVDVPTILMTSCQTDAFQLRPGDLQIAAGLKARGFTVTMLDDGANCDHYDWPVAQVNAFLDSP